MTKRKMRKDKQWYTKHYKKIKDWATWTTLKPRANSGAAEGYAVAAPLVDMSLKGDYI